MAVFEAGFKRNMEKQEGIDLVAAAIRAGIFNDLGSGSNVDVVVITKSTTEVLRNYQVLNPRPYRREKGYIFPKGITPVVGTYVHPVGDKIDVVSGDAMEL